MMAARARPDVLIEFRISHIHSVIYQMDASARMHFSISLALVYIAATPRLALIDILGRFCALCRMLAMTGFRSFRDFSQDIAFQREEPRALLQSHTQPQRHAYYAPGTPYFRLRWIISLQLAARRRRTPLKRAEKSLSWAILLKAGHADCATIKYYHFYSGIAFKKRIIWPGSRNNARASLRRHNATSKAGNAFLFEPHADMPPSTPPRSDYAYDIAALITSPSPHFSMQALANS